MNFSYYSQSCLKYVYLIWANIFKDYDNHIWQITIIICLTIKFLNVKLILILNLNNIHLQNFPENMKAIKSQLKNEDKIKIPTWLSRSYKNLCFLIITLHYTNIILPLFQIQFNHFINFAWHLTLVTEEFAVVQIQRSRWIFKLQSNRNFRCDFAFNAPVTQTELIVSGDSTNKSL